MESTKSKMDRIRRRLKQIASTASAPTAEAPEPRQEAHTSRDAYERWLAQREMPLEELALLAKGGRTRSAWTRLKR